MPKWSSSALNDPKKYRFGFNGKEDDDEWAKQDYGFRIYDGRIGRFLSVDPLMGSYPELTTYQFASNTPIQAIDLDGLEMKLSTRVENGTTINTITLDADIIDDNYQCEAGYSESCMKQIFSPENLERTSIFLSSNNLWNRDLDEKYEFKFGNIDVFTREKANESKSSFKIVLTQLGDSDLERDYEGITYGQVKEKFQTQTNTIYMDLPAVLNEYGDNAKASFFNILAHEMAHAMGLRHAYDEVGPAADPESKWSIKDHPENLMRSGTLGFKLFKEQFETMVELVKSQQSKNGNE